MMMRRHDRVWLHPSAVFSSNCMPVDGFHWQQVQDWICRGRPLVVPRQAASATQIVLGLALPAHSDGKRLSIQVERKDISAVFPPMPLAKCLQILSGRDRDCLVWLDAAMHGAGVRIGIYGSMAWELVSGETYRNEASDLDVVCDVIEMNQVNMLLVALQKAAAGLSFPLDGEIRFPNGQAVAWRELLICRNTPGAKVLAKGDEEIELVAIETLMDGLREG
ncbi:malonate decarboxylase holo-[acyl-carrier-protein] synthase [Thauera sp. Sel9]|uniref:malonate decarboxylase holo-[acyl-carrier-protein] synthase n=1 Tax=Thauera sp. Sel9 TaxID=2974299 RepID=UPI0021E12B7E|nr:malonate decarboxylase holo-[acyl-carrier-protein] synthase [Thauera sp. Sel9]MCV2217996.1 malonate decarboxylase holo-[acyl-carrier-protein] synthase [Thauera sp. Sel9]